MNKEKLFWVSWVCKEDDYRPVKYPPNENILGWWCSGYTSEDDATLCSLIKGISRSSVKESIKKDWPEFNGEFRFFKEKDNTTLSDRWPLDDKWMSERITQWNMEHVE